MDAQVTAAMVAGGASLVISCITFVRTFVLAKRQQRHEEALTDQKLHRQYALEFAAERLVIKFLEHQEWPFRSFEIIQAYFGGFDEPELRRILVQAGAMRFESKSGYEMWALMTRVPKKYLDDGITKLNRDPVRISSVFVAKESAGPR